MLNSHRLHHRMEVDVLRARPRHRRLCCTKLNFCMLTIHHPRLPMRLGVAPSSRLLPVQSSSGLTQSRHQSHIFVLSNSVLTNPLVHRLRHLARHPHIRQPTKHIQSPPSHPQNTTPSLRFSTKTSSTTPAISIPPALCHLRPQPSTPTSPKPTFPPLALRAL